MTQPPPLTVEELRAALAAAGLHPDEVGRAEDPESRRDEGACLIGHNSDGSVDVIGLGRGYEVSRQRFVDEASAVAHLAADRLTPGPPMPEQTEAERRADGERARRMACEALDELAASNRARKQARRKARWKARWMALWKGRR